MSLFSGLPLKGVIIHNNEQKLHEGDNEYAENRGSGFGEGLKLPVDA
jgi:hypothetical protein